MKYRSSNNLFIFRCVRPRRVENAVSDELAERHILEWHRDDEVQYWYSENPESVTVECSMSCNTSSESENDIDFRLPPTVQDFLSNSFYK